MVYEAVARKPRGLSPWMNGYVSTLPAVSSVVQGVSQSPDDALTCLSN